MWNSIQMSAICLSKCYTENDKYLELLYNCNDEEVRLNDSPKM